MKLVIIALVLATSVASAEPDLAPRHQKSQRLAAVMSFGLTTAGVTTFFVTNSLATPDESGRRLTPKYKLPLYLTAGVLLAVGPSSGHLYAGEYWNRATTVRLVSGGVMVIAAGAIDNCCSEGDHNGNEGAAVVTVIAGAVFLAASVYECGTAARAVRRYNGPGGPAVTLVPVLSREPGVALVGQF